MYPGVSPAKAGLRAVFGLSNSTPVSPPPPPPPTFGVRKPMGRLIAGRRPAWLLGILGVCALAVAAALLWLLPANQAQAQDDAARPEITAGPTIISSPASGDPYGPKEAISVAVTFSKAVTVTGNPRLRLTIGGKKRWARYDRSDQDGTRLIFSYKVKSADADDDGVSIGKNQLKLNDGAIGDADGNAARLKHPKLPDQAGHQVNGSPADDAPNQADDPPPTNNEPEFASENAARSVAENALPGTYVGDPVTADDGDDDTLTYALAGADAGAFDLDTATGQIQVKDDLDYEAKSGYSVTVTVHDGKAADGGEYAGVDDSIEVAISVANVDEAGKVSLVPETEAPQVGSALSAILLDPDGGVTGLVWTWESSADGSEWEAVAGASDAAYTPSEDDAGQYLRATASYSDGHGPGKSSQATTEDPVEFAPQPPDPENQRQTTAQTVASDWSLIPTGVSAGQKFRLLFITSTSRNGQSSNIADYNTFVQMRAAANTDITGVTGFTAKFGALVSTSAVSAKENTDTESTDTDAPIYWLDGAKVADDYADFYDGSWDSCSGKDESGASVANNTEIWTGSTSGGEKGSVLGSGIATRVSAVGRITSACNNGLRISGLAFLVTTKRFYALSPVLTVQAAPTITGVAITSSPDSDETYGYRDDITVWVIFNEAVTVAGGTPTLALKIGGATRQATYASGSGTNTLTFSHAVRIDDEDADGISIDGGTIVTLPSGVTIQDADSNNVNLAYPRGLAAQSGHKVDPTPQPQTVPADWALIPKDSSNNPLVTAGQSFRLLFVTSANTPGQASTDVHYNNHVKTAAENNTSLAPFSGEFRALVSSQYIDARGNTRTRHTTTPPDPGASDPIYWVMGAKAANNYADFYDGAWNYPTPGEGYGRSETGGSTNDWNIWTGSKSDGTAEPTNIMGTANPASGTPSSGKELQNVKTATNDNGYALYALSPVITVADDPTVWSATLTVDERHGFFGCGILPSGHDNCSTALTDDDFTFGGTTYTIDVLQWDSESEKLHLGFTSGIPVNIRQALGSLNLHAGSNEVTIASGNPGMQTLQWNIDLGWEDNQSVSVSLTEPATAPTIKGIPRITSSPASGDTYGLGETITVAVKFTKAVTVVTTGGTPQLRIRIGNGNKWANYSSGSGTDTLTFSYTVAAADSDANGIGIRSNQLQLNGGTIKDAGDNNSNLKHRVLRPRANHKVDGSLTSIAPTAQTVPEGWTYIPKDSSSNPLVTAGQSFRLLFVTSTVPDPTSSDIATYNSLVQGRAATNSALTNAGGTSFSGQFRALISTATADARDNTATAPAGSSYTTGEGVPIYWLNGAKVADDYADFYDSDGWDSRAATIESGIANNTGATGMWTGSNQDGTKHTQFPAGHSRATQIGSIDTAGFEVSGGIGYALSHFASRLPYYALSPVLTVAGAPDTTAPTISAISITSDPRADQTYSAGDTIVATVTFSETVNVTGAPTLALTVGANIRQATYASGSGTNTLTFSYTVVGGDTDTNGVSIAGGSIITLPTGASIKDGSDNDANLAYAAGLSDQSGHKVVQTPLQITGPSIEAVGINSRPWAYQTYGLGDAISVVVKFSAPVTVAGAPTLALTVGANTRQASYSYISTISTKKKILTFSYTVVSSDTDTDGVSIAGGTIITLPTGASITNANGDAAGLSYPAGLAAQSGHKVDGSDTGPRHNPIDAPSPQVVPHNWAHTATGVNPGESFRLLFVTSDYIAATSMNVATYNNHAQTAANTNTNLMPFKGEFRAVLSTALLDARDYTGTNAPAPIYTFGGDPAPSDYASQSNKGAPIYWLGGTKVADDYADFYDNSWDSRAAKTQSGSGYPNRGIWTGSNANGTAHTTNPAGAANARAGSLVAAGESPLSHTSSAASTIQNGIYVLSPVIIVAPAPPATTPPAPGDTAPRGLRVVTMSGGVTISWAPPVEADGVTGYEIWMDRIADTDDTPQWRKLSDPYWYAFIYILNGIENGKTYEFKLRAKYGSRTGDASAPVYATPLGSQDYWTPAVR